MSCCRRRLSIIPLMPSPGRPKITSTASFAARRPEYRQPSQPWPATPFGASRGSRPLRGQYVAGDHCKSDACRSRGRGERLKAKLTSIWRVLQGRTRPCRNARTADPPAMQSENPASLVASWADREKAGARRRQRRRPLCQEMPHSNRARHRPPRASYGGSAAAGTGTRRGTAADAPSSGIHRLAETRKRTSLTTRGSARGFRRVRFGLTGTLFQ